LSYTFKFIDHTADIAVEAEGDSLEELFTASAHAWKQSIFENIEIAALEEKQIKIIEPDQESLLVKFLDELNFLFQTKHWVYNFIKKINITKEEEWNLSAELTGEPFDEMKHRVNLEIKAVTFHQMEIRKKNGKYFTRIVFDI
jgi:SHS2 domain-containing protein